MGLLLTEIHIEEVSKNPMEIHIPEMYEKCLKMQWNIQEVSINWKREEILIWIYVLASSYLYIIAL